MHVTARWSRTTPASPRRTTRSCSRTSTGSSRRSKAARTRPATGRGSQKFTSRRAPALEPAACAALYPGTRQTRQEHSYCCEAFREQLARLQSWSDSSPPPSLPPSFRGASRHIFLFTPITLRVFGVVWSDEKVRQSRTFSWGPHCTLLRAAGAPAGG